MTQTAELRKCLKVTFSELFIGKDIIRILNSLPSNDWKIKKLRLNRKNII